MRIWPDITGALCANSHPGSYTGQDAFNQMFPVIERERQCGIGQANESPNSYRGGVASNLMARDYKDGRDLIQEDSMEQQNRKYVLRRLTPTECARLQGFPDWWCDGAEGSDSAQYKLWGNGVGLPCVVDILGRIAREYEGGEVNG